MHLRKRSIVPTLVYIYLFCKYSIQYFSSFIICATLKKCFLGLPFVHLSQVAAAIAAAEDRGSVCSRRVELAGALGFYFLFTP